MAKKDDSHKASHASELRRDVVSGDWVAIATGRAKRPHDFLRQRRESFRQPKNTCPFENIHDEALLILPAGKTMSAGASRSGRNDWIVQVIPNKYPAFGVGTCAVLGHVGPYEWTEGVGAHEVVIFRDHDKSLATMTHAEVGMVIAAYQERFRALARDDCAQYVSVFHNHGRLSGASISHPHSQIVSLPVIPPDVARSLAGSAEYFRRNRSCVHCAVVQYELARDTRVIYENGRFAVLAPYASKTAFEMRLFPIRHSAEFENMDEDDRAAAADALGMALAKLHKGLKNPDYNFFLHTAPVKDGQTAQHYHWHIEILPKTAIWAGFEIGTGIEISTITPESAAAFLKNVKI